MTVEHYIMTLLWSAADDEVEDIMHELSAEFRQRAERDWTDFRTKCEDLGFDPEFSATEPLHPDNNGDWWNAVAHDFALTRNGHGCGFWDGRWSQPWGDILTDLSKTFGEVHGYVGDNNLIYME